jgi:RHS repeat-associated protein
VTMENIGQIVLHFEADAQGDPQLAHRYLWGPAVDQILADEQITDPTAPGNILWPLTDHLNTVRDLAAYDADTDTTTIVNHLIYDAYGRLVSQSNPDQTTLFAFTARPFDPATNLQNNLNRWYDAEVGRWLSEDPIGFDAGDANLRRYVGNGPTNATDPSGLDAYDGPWIGARYDGPWIGASPPVHVQWWNHIRGSVVNWWAPESPIRITSRERIHNMLGDNMPAKEYVDELLRLALVADSGRQWLGDRRTLPIGEEHAPGCGGPCAWFVKRFMEELVAWHNETKLPWPEDFRIDIEQWKNPDSFYGRDHVAVRVLLTLVDENGDTRRFVFYFDAGRHRARLQGNLGDRSHVFFPEDIPKNYFPP